LKIVLKKINFNKKSIQQAIVNKIRFLCEESTG
jgi:hypothetical protein